MLLYKEILLCIFLSCIVLASILFLSCLIYWCFSCVFLNIKDLNNDQFNKENICDEKRT